MLKTLKRTLTIGGKIYEVDLTSIKKEDLESLRAAFNDLDQDHSGQIGVDEMMLFMEEQGHPQTRDQIIENFFDDIDKNHDYLLDFDEFVTRLAPRVEIITDKVIDAFRNFAGSESQFLDAIQLKKILMNLGNAKFTEEEVYTCFSYLGIKITDNIEYEKFVKDWREKAKIFE